MDASKIPQRRLQRILEEQRRSARLLVRRDLELQRANDQLRELDKDKSEFVSIAAHQLRTPLSAIRWAHQMVMDGEAGKITDEQKALLAQAQDSVQRMIDLVNNLLDADHLEFGQIQYVFSDINIVLLLNEVIGELAPMARERKVKLDYSTLDTPCSVRADPSRLKEAFLNVLNNAIKYTPEGGTVSVQLTETNDTLTISIKDTGIGIPKDGQTRLFQKFVRMENAKKIDANGSGLGLFIVKKIIDGHKGKITLESEEGTGTTFYITLPKAKNSQGTCLIPKK